MNSLGLKISSNFVAYSLIQKGEENKFLSTGIHMFKANEDPKLGGSLQIARSGFRRRRAWLKRRIKRSINIRNIFKTLGVSTSPSSEELRKVWDLRAKGLDEKLSIRELQIIIVYMSKKRGYKSNRLSNSPANENGKILEAIARTKNEIKEAGARTFGEFLKDKRQKRNRKGEYLFFADREMIENEFDLILAKQLELGLEGITEDLVEKIREVLFYQIPMKTLGHFGKKCYIYPEENVLHRDTFTANIFNLLRKINDLNIYRYKPEYETYTLNTRQIGEIVLKVFDKKTLTYKALRKMLGLSIDWIINIEEETLDKSFFNFTSFHDLYPIFSKVASFPYVLDKDSPEDILDNPKAIKFYDELINCLAINFERDELLHEVIKVFEDNGVSEFLDLYDKEEDDEKFDIYDIVSLENFTTMHSLSKKAMEFFIEHFQYGKSYASIFNEHFAKNSGLEKLVKLPRFEETNNSVINRTCAEVRKVINALKREHEIDEIYFYSVPDFGLNMSDRRRLAFLEREHKKVRTSLVELLKEICINDLSEETIQKAVLWKEQGERCIYTGKFIAPDLLNTDQVSIINILPYGATFDNSSDNKALIYTNHDIKRKSKSLALLAKTDERINAATFFSDIQNMYNDKVLRHKKYERLMTLEFDEAELKLKNRMDNRVVNRRIINHFSSYLVPRENVFSIRNSVVDNLKEYLSLNQLEFKDSRDKVDSKYEHILDAMIVNFASKDLLEKSAAYFDSVDKTQDFTYSVSFVEELENAKINRMISCDASGSLHGSTIYKLPKKLRHKYKENETFMLSVNEYLDEENRIIKRVPLETIDKKSLKNLVCKLDPGKHLYSEIVKRLDNEPDPEKAFVAPIFLNDKFNHPKRVKEVEIFVETRSGIFKHQGVAANGDFIRLDLFKDTDGNILSCPIYAMDVIRGKLPNFHITEDGYEPLNYTHKFLASINKNQKVLFTKTKKDSKMEITGFFLNYNRSNNGVLLTDIIVKTYNHQGVLQEKVSILENVFYLKSVDNVQVFHYDILESKHLIDFKGNQPQFK